MAKLPQLIGPDGFPRAPTQEEWEPLTPAQREAVVASLPDEVTDAEMSPPEGDLHYDAKNEARETLRHYFENRKRSVCVAAELPVYYPGEKRFAPDLLAVLDVPVHDRGKWVVSDEGKGLSVVIEVHVSGSRKKDAERNVALYGRLGIPEYFIYDRAALRLFGYRLPGPDAKLYQPILPQQGLYKSEQLGLDLSIEDDKLRFSVAGAVLPAPRELIHRLERLTDTLQQKADAALELLAETEAREEKERARAEAAERRLREMEEQLRGK
jgi:Uma2 family endonuclease